MRRVVLVLLLSCLSAGVATANVADAAASLAPGPWLTDCPCIEPIHAWLGLCVPNLVNC
jgi:hypothetical protein